MKKFDVLFEEIKKSNRVLIIGHTNPDGDCIASMLTIGLLLESLEKDYEINHSDSYPACLNFFPYLEKIKICDSIQGSFDLTIAVDTPSLKRMCYNYDSAKMGKLLVIDHHFTNEGFGDENFVFKSIGSTCEIIYEFFKKIMFPFTPQIATLLFTGIATDTGYFQYRTANAHTFNIAADLINRGAEHNIIYEEIWKNKKFEHVKLISQIISSTEIILPLKLGWVKIDISISESGSLDENQYSDIINQITSINGIRVAVMFRQVNGSTVCEFRSRSKFPVYMVAQFFGGGGHFYASGCTIPYKIDKTEKIVISKIKEMIKEFDLSGEIRLEGSEFVSDSVCSVK